MAGACTLLIQPPGSVDAPDQGRCHHGAPNQLFIRRLLIAPLLPPSNPPHPTSPYLTAPADCQVGVNLGQPGGYLDTIAKATADIDIQVVFCNAGYVLTGFFVDV